MKDHEAYKALRPHAAKAAHDLQALDKERQSIPDPPVTDQDKERLKHVLKAMGHLHNEIGQHLNQLASHIG